MVGSIINLAVWKEGFLLGKNWTRIYIKKERYIKESYRLQSLYLFLRRHGEVMSIRRRFSQEKMCEKEQEENEELSQVKSSLLAPS